jgi:predicted Zn finger-like uncharacterized protein
MKITCSACHASYNLPDDKVAGRRVKVRCKRCSEPIVVDGSQLASIPPPPDFEDEATRVMASPGGEGPNMWTVNLSDTEQGDMTDEEIVAGWQAGVVTEDAYVWREGMGDWKPILEVPELVSLLSQATEPEPEPPPPPAPVFAPTPSPAKVAPQVPSPAKDPGHAMFGSSPVAAPRIPSPPKAPAAPTPGRSNAELFANKPKPKREKPKYEASEARNENSMLFSLDALKAAARETTSDEPPQSVRVDEHLLVMGGGPDLFAAPLIQVDATPPPPASAKYIAPTATHASRGPSIGAAPVMDYPAPQKKGGKGWIFAVLAVVILAGGGYYAYTTFVASGSATASSSTPITAPVPEPKETVATVVEPTPSVEATAEPSDTTASAVSGVSAKPTSGGSGAQQGSNTPPSTGGGRPAPPAATAVTPPPEEKPASDAPPFSTDAAKSALSSAASNAASCKSSDGPTGGGKVQVTFAPSGRVTSANVVEGPFGGTSVGGCIARTFRQARVPAFSGEPQTVSKSFKIP